MAIFGYSLQKVNKKSQLIQSDNTLINKINQLLLSQGFAFTQYDDNNKTYVDKGYNMNPDVYAVVSQKATEVNRIPFFIKSVKDLQKSHKYKQFNRTNKNALTPQLAIKKAVLEKAAFEDSEFEMPLEKPNPNQSWSEFFALYETFMDLTGNFYIYLVSPEEGKNAGTPIEMYILPAHLMQIVLKPKADIINDSQPISHYVLTEGNTTCKIDYNDIVHIKLPNPNFDLAGSHLYGMSPLRSALDNIQSSNSASLLNAKTLANGGSFGFISPKAGQTFGEEQAKSIKDRLVEMDNDPKRLSNLAGVSTEMVLTRISLTTDELKPFAYLEHDQKAICNVLHWDDKLLNSDDGAKYDNYKTALKRAITSGISPHLRLLEEAFNVEILPRFKDYKGTVLLFDESQLPEMQDDMVSLTKWLNDALDRGVITRDEYRLAINYTELGTAETKELTVTSNTISLKEALATPLLE